MHPRIHRRREGLAAVQHRSIRNGDVRQLMDTIQVIEEKLRIALAGPGAEEMLAQLQSARRLIELAIDGHPVGNDMLICANAVMLHLHQRIERMRAELAT